MNNENGDINNDKLVKAFKYKSMKFDKQKESLIKKYNEILKSYKEVCAETDEISQNINTLNYLYEHEIKINNFYNNYASGPKDVDNLDVTDNNVYFVENKTKELTMEQKLRIQINRNAAMILREEKKLNTVHSKLDKSKAEFIATYKNHLSRKN